MLPMPITWKPRPSRPLQGTLADRTLLQVDQAEPEDQNIFWHIEQCPAHSDPDRFVRLSPSCFPEIQGPTGHFHAEDAVIIIVESV